MSEVKTFRITVKCDWGTIYENAFVAIRHWSKSSQETGSSIDCVEDYAEESNIEAVAYRANFWPYVAARAEGKKSRPLVDPGAEGDVECDLFQVDLSHIQSIQVINSSMPADEKKWRLIELDIARRFI